MRHTFLRACIALAVLVPGASAQEKEEKPVTLPFDGPDVFCHILYSKGITPLATFAEALAKPKETMIIICGDPFGIDVMRFRNSDAQPFREQGGNLLVATDYALKIDHLALNISGYVMFRNEDMCFGKVMTCPWIPYFDKNVDNPKDARDHPLFSLLKKEIATNCPSYFTSPKEKWPADCPLEPVLCFPRDPTKQGFGGPRWGPAVYIAASPKDSPPAGRTVVIAGYGMLTNGMMLHESTDNLDFAINSVQWLREGPNKTKRDKALLVVNGEVITNFNRNLSPPPKPIPMPTVPMVNRLLRGLEDERFFDWLLERVLGDHYQRAVPVMLALFTCGVLLYGAKKFLDGRAMHENAAPRLVGGVTAAAGASRERQRQEALRRRGNVRDEARQLVRHWLRAEFGITEAQLANGAKLEGRADGSLVSAWIRQRRLDFALNLASADDGVMASRSDFARLVRILPALSRGGGLTLLLDGKELRQKSESNA